MTAEDLAKLTFIALTLLLMAIACSWKVTLTIISVILGFFLTLLCLTLFYKWLGFE